MKRKTILHGPSTLTISLPSKWVKKFNVQKGDELDVEEKGNEIHIRTETTKKTKEKKVIDCKNNQRLGKSILTALYLQGYEEIEIRFENSSYLRTIKNLLSRDLVGFEIIRQTSNSCTIKDLAKTDQEEFKNILKSLWILLLDLSKESYEALKENDKERLETIQVVDSSINKFTNYCLRILSTSNAPGENSYPYYFLIRSLENLADKYKDMCLAHPANQKIQQKQLEGLFKTNKHLEELFELYYRYNEEKIEEFFNKTKQTLHALAK